MSKKILGTTLAMAAALAFTVAPITASMAAATPVDHYKCVGGNACKGQSVCQTKTNKCKSLNGCKGQGVVMTASKKACKKVKYDLKHHKQAS